MQPQKEISNPELENQVKIRRGKPGNRLSCAKYRAKYYTPTPLPISPINGQKYNPKYKWMGLAVELDVGEWWWVKGYNEARTLARAMKRIGYAAATRKVSDGVEVCKTGVRNG